MDSRFSEFNKCQIIIYLLLLLELQRQIESNNTCFGILAVLSRKNMNLKSRKKPLLESFLNKP